VNEVQSLGGAAGVKGRYLVLIAVAAFLLFAGMSAFQILCPTHWYVECVVRDSSGRVETRKNFQMPTEDLAKEFLVLVEKNGQRCTVIPLRECPWDL
jgi:hypothetical protein